MPHETHVIFKVIAFVCATKGRLSLKEPHEESSLLSVLRMNLKAIE